MDLDDKGYDWIRAKHGITSSGESVAHA
jgi:hypothetical protein